MQTHFDLCVCVWGGGMRESGVYWGMCVCGGGPSIDDIPLNTNHAFNLQRTISRISGDKIARYVHIYYMLVYSFKPFYA